MGHATRCIPIIHALIDQDYEPILAGNGTSLELLRKEFPNLTFFELPGCDMRYSKWPFGLFVNVLLRAPCMLGAKRREQKIISQLIDKQNITGVISDNRFGVFNAQVPCVYMTHQVEVRAGIWTRFATFLHRRIIRKFNECWIPDRLKKGLSGQLGHVKNPPPNLRHIGILSRLKPKNNRKKYDILVLLSGPEPQRTILERKLVDTLLHSELKIALVRGTADKGKLTDLPRNIKQFDLLLTPALEGIIAASDLIIARSGYSTIMDLSSMQKRAFFIPTPGQPEQEYLAKHLESLRITPYCNQRDFNLEELERIHSYTGFNEAIEPLDLKLFELFEGKGKS